MQFKLTDFDELLVSQLIGCTQASRTELLEFLGPFLPVEDDDKEYQYFLPSLEIKDPEWEVILLIVYDYAA